MRFLVRLRPNAAYLAFIVLGAILIGLGLNATEGIFHYPMIAVGGVILVLLGVPVVVSTVFRVPVLVVEDAGLRLPLMGVRLAWAEVARVRQAPGPGTGAVLLIVPRDEQAALARMRPWLRTEGRSNIARYGTPIVMSGQSMDRTLDEIQSAVARFRPVTPAGPGHPSN